MKNRKRNRKLGFDYASNNLYFITICVQNKVCCFGDIIYTSKDTHFESSKQFENYPNNSNVKMQFNQYGKIVNNQFHWLESQYPYIEIHNYVIMPNHIHAIIEIDSNKVLGQEIKVKSLSSLIGALKTTSSKLIHESGFIGFSWQRSFHDHIIRDDKAYQNIFNYINQNPIRWYTDKFYNKS